ncbi:MAG: hypothetical protein WCJ58_08055 [bacterium]
MASATKEAAKSGENPLKRIADFLLGKTAEDKARVATEAGLTGAALLTANSLGMITPGLAALHGVGSLAITAGMGLALLNPIIAGSAAFIAGGFALSKLITTMGHKK